MCVYAHVYTDTCTCVHMEARGRHPILYHSLPYLPEAGTVTGSGPRKKAKESSVGL